MILINGCILEMIRKADLFFNPEDHEQGFQEFRIEVKQEIELFIVKWFKMIHVIKEERRIVVSGFNGSPMDLLPILEIGNPDILCQCVVPVDLDDRYAQPLLAVRPVNSAMIPAGLLFIGFKCFKGDSFRMHAFHHICNWW